MYRSALREEHLKRDFKPGSLCPLARVIKTRELRKIFWRIAQSRVANGIDQTNPFESTHVFLRKRRERLPNQILGSGGKFLATRTVFNLINHSVLRSLILLKSFKEEIDKLQVKGGQHRHNITTLASDNESYVYCHPVYHSRQWPFLAAYLDIVQCLLLHYAFFCLELFFPNRA